MSNIIGRFYFKQTQSKNLLGEFSNNASDENYVEAAFKTTEEDGFEGIYETKWIEKDVSIYNLSIKSISIKNSIIYYLEWKTGNGKVIFKGQGMLVDNILIGNYDNLITE